VTDFHDALKAFLDGALDYAGLEQRLILVASHDPSLAPQILSALDELHRRGRLPPQLHQVLKSRLAAASQQAPAATPAGKAGAEGGIPGAPGPAESGPGATGPPPMDKTRIRPPVRPSPPAREAGPPVDRRTRVRPPPSPPSAPAPAPSASVREPTPAGPSATGGRGATARENATGGPATAGTGRSTKSGTGGKTGSSWRDIEEWSEEEARPLNPGDMLKSRFVLESILGRGGMGVVFKARDLRKEEAQDRNPHIAVKVLGEDFKRHPESLKALQRESRKAQNLAHPNIVTVYDFDREGPNVFMTMEYLEGTPLDKLIKGRNRQGLPQAEALVMVNEMGQALAYAHAKGVVHSDFKPSNAFQTQDGIVKVFDFGIARATQHAGRAEGTETLFDAGSLGALTPAYASCEMLDGQPPDPRDDIYALGCVTYELLTGRHPFNSTPCNRARDKRLLPDSVGGLSRRQWKALLRALAFKREERTPSIEEFLDGIRPKRVSKLLVAGVAAVVVLASMVGVLTVPQFLHTRRVDSLVAAINKGDDASIEQTLEQLRDLEADDRERVRQQARDPIIAFFERQAEYHIDEAQGRHDYPKAEQFLNQAGDLYPDSATVQNIISRIQGRKNRVLNDLTTRFNEYLEQGRLLPTGDGTDIASVLLILGQIDPTHSLLEDPRIPVAYADAAQRALQERAFERADQVLVAGLNRFPGDVRLVNIEDSLRAERARAESTALIAGVAGRLEERAPSFQTIEDFEQGRADILQLKELAPDHPLLASVEASLQALVDQEQTKAISQRAWLEGEQTLAGLEGLLDVAYLQQKRQALQTALALHERAIQDRFEEFSQAVSERRLGATEKNNALVLRQALADAGAGPAMLQQADASIARTYLEMAREARAEKRWEEARGRVALGLAQGTSLDAHISLRAELEEIGRAEGVEQQMMAEAERQRLERERLARVDALRARFREGLQKEPFAPDDARALLGTLDQLAAISPTDALLSEGRRQVASRFAEQASALGEAGRWKEALALSHQALQVIPESEVLSKGLAEIERGHRSAIDLARQKDIDRRKGRLASLLAQADLSQDWEAGLRDALKGVEALLPAGDPYLADVREQTARVFLQRVREMRDAKRFSEAGSLLERGRKFAPELEAFELEQQAIAAAGAAFERETQETARLAKIQGLKDTLVTQATANDVRRAKATLKDLQAKVPGDVFVTRDAPQEIGGAYLRLAERRAKGDDYAGAIDLVRAGLEIAPGMDSLQVAIGRFQHARKLQELQRTLAKSKSLPVSDIRKTLAELAREDPTAHPRLEKELAAKLETRIRKTAAGDFKAAEGLLADAKRIFPNSRQLAGITLKRPKPRKPPVAVAKAPPPKPVAKAKPRATPTAKGACTARFAGYGRRKRANCYDVLAGGSKGPTLVVVPPGSGIGEPFAISRYEISIADYNNYCRLSGACTPVSSKDPNLPVTNISVEKARSYARWLSETTGFDYRLPTDEEWTYAATAAGKQPGKDYNCRLRVGGKLMKGKALIDVRSGKQNGWGLKNYVGNAQEWVETPSGIKARGGAYVDRMSRCGISLSTSHDGGADATTGFRLVRGLPRDTS